MDASCLTPQTQAESAPRRFPNLDSSDLSKNVTGDPVSTINGEALPFSSRRVANNTPPRPASLLILASAGKSGAGTMAVELYLVAQEHHSSVPKSIPVTMRFVRISSCRIFLRISRGIMENVMRDA